MTARGRVPTRIVVGAHLALYRARPDVLRAGCAKHADRLTDLARIWA